MRTKIFFVNGLLFITMVACLNYNDTYDNVVIPEISFTQTVTFEKNLSAYKIFDSTPANLIPANNFILLELSAVLFTDYAYKQRLVKIPDGTQMKKLDNESIDFPDGTILVKTFFYYKDERDTSLGKRIIETRLLIKENSKWNIATYIWNNSQTDASLTLKGSDTEVSWINTNGNNLSTLYHIPTQNECMTCHQSNSKLIPIGPNLRNLNRMVKRNSANINQLSHMQAIGILNEFSVEQIPQMVDYNDLSTSLEERGRAYLAMNCAHCHNPNGWDRSNQRRFDFRYELPLNQTGILSKEGKILRTLMNGRMPFIGTTMLDEEGIRLITNYLNTL